MLTESEYRDFYATYFSCLPEDYDEVVTHRLKVYQDRINRLKALVRNTEFSILDIGAATGEFLHEASCAGLQATGLEWSADARKRALQKYGIRLREDSLSDLPERETFDVVHMHHVFEHVVHPISFLTQVARVLKPGGYFVAEVPFQFDNWHEVLTEKMQKPKSSPYSPSSLHHPFFYYPKTLKRVIAKYFEIISLRTSTQIENPSLIGKLFMLIGDSLFKMGANIEIIARKPFQHQPIIYSKLD